MIGDALLSDQSAGTAKEDRDYILEYKSIDLSGLKRETILDVPVDNITRDEAVAAILEMVEKKDGPHHVLFLDPLKLMRIRRSKKLGFVGDRRVSFSRTAGGSTGRRRSTAGHSGSASP